MKEAFSGFHDEALQDLDHYESDKLLKDFVWWKDTVRGEFRDMKGRMESVESLA